MRPRQPLPESLSSRSFSASQGLDSGVSRKRLRGRDLARPFRGVYVPTANELDFEGRCRALAQRLPAWAYFCAITAAQLQHIPLAYRHETAARTHVAVPAPYAPPTGASIHGHMFELDESRIAVVRGLRVTPPEVTWCGLGTYLSVPELVAAGDFLVHWRSPEATIDGLKEETASWDGKRGVLKLRRAVDLLNERSESPKESELRVIMVESGLAGVQANYPIRTSGGYSYRADIAIPERKAIIEYQSAFHETPEAFRADMTRISRLEADGWLVIQVNKDDLRNPIELIARIRHALFSRSYYPVEWEV